MVNSKKIGKTGKLFISISIVCCIVFVMPLVANAMHIMEGYLPLGHCIAWGAVCLPFIATGVIRLRRTVAENRRALMLLAMSGAYVFVLSSLKIPSVTGSCSHMTGAGLSAILFGVGTTSILGIIVLMFQALLLAHGGLTTLGANAFSMAIAGPAMTMLLYKIGKKMKLNNSAIIFVAVSIGSLLTYCLSALQLAIAHPGDAGIATSAIKFLGVFAPTQIPLAVLEGILTVLVVMGMEKYARRELSAISYFAQSPGE